MRKQELSELFDLDRELIEYLGANHDGQIPQQQILDMIWNTTPYLWITLYDKIIVKEDQYLLACDLYFK